MKNIYVGNLSFSATEHMVRSLFEKYGAVERVNIVTDRDTGQARGFGFVEMTNDAEAVKAINALNGMDLEGRGDNREIAKHVTAHQADAAKQGDVRQALGSPGELPPDIRHRETQDETRGERTAHAEALGQIHIAYLGHQDEIRLARQPTDEFGVGINCGRTA